MHTKTHQLLKDLVEAGLRFRKTPIVDDEFPAMRDHFDGLLDAANTFLKLLGEVNSQLPDQAQVLKPLRIEDVVSFPQKSSQPTLEQCQRMVLDFHQKHEIPWGLHPQQNPKVDVIRAHLINEELSELLLAIADKSIIKMADALADLLYVVLGAGVSYGLPLQELFVEVHRSNMTKAPQKDRDMRIRDKGRDYQPPDIEGVLRKFDSELLGIHGEQG